MLTFKKIAAKVLRKLHLLKERRYSVFIDYPVNPEPRYGYDKPCHEKLYEIINRGRDKYKQYSENLLRNRDYLLKIRLRNENGVLGIDEPFWLNGWFSGLDAISLYGLLSYYNPENYFEVGSGNSTKFAKKAILDRSLKTKITSFDPKPRSEIDLICDNIIRKPLEKADISCFDKLEKNDILFFDSSHRVFTNSDVATIFLDIIPKLKKGVIFGFHDIFLPNDYPSHWNNRYYSEQYMLAALLLAEGGKYEIIGPNAFIHDDIELGKDICCLLEDLRIRNMKEPENSAFWLKVK